MKLDGAKGTNVLHEGQGSPLHQGDEPEPEGRGLQQVLVEHAVEQPWLRRRDGKIVLAVQGVGEAQDGLMSAGGKETRFPVGKNA